MKGLGILAGALFVDLQAYLPPPFPSPLNAGHHRYQYTFEGGEITFEMSLSQDGKKWQSLMLGQYRPAPS